MQPNPWENQPWSFEIPFIVAVESGSVEAVRQLLDTGTDPNLRDKSGMTPIMYARNWATYQQLLAAGADPKAIDFYNRDALQHFVSVPVSESQFSIDDLRMIATVGLGVNTVLKYENWTRLFVAAFNQDAIAIEQLLMLGADITLGRSPLSGLCWHANQNYSEAIADGMELLIAAGCDVNATDAAGDTLLHNASLGYSHAFNEACFHSSSDGCNLTAILTLLKHGADPDPIGSGSYTPLMNAAQECCPEAVTALLEAGANRDRRNEEGLTAINMVDARIQRLTRQKDSPEIEEEVRSYFEKALADAILCAQLLSPAVS